MSKRSNRLWETEKVVSRRKPYLCAIYSNKIPENIKSRLLGRCRNMHPYDCGKSNCVLCSYEKIFDKKHISDKKSDIDFKEQKKEYL